MKEEGSAKAEPSSSYIDQICHHHLLDLVSPPFFAAMDWREWAQAGKKRLLWAGLLAVSLALTLGACRGLLRTGR